MALTFEEGCFDVLDYAVSFSTTVLDSLDRFARFHCLLSDATRIEIVRDASTVRIVRLVAGTHPQDQDAFLAGLCQRLRTFTGRDLVPRELWFEHARHAEHRLAEFFRCPLRFGRPHCELAFAIPDAELPLLDPKPRLAAILDRYMTELHHAGGRVSWYFPAGGSDGAEVLGLESRTRTRGPLLQRREQPR